MKAPKPMVRVTMTPPPPLPWTPTLERREGLFQDIYYTAVRLLLETHQIRGEQSEKPIPSLTDYPYFPCGTLELPVKAGQFRLGNEVSAAINGSVCDTVIDVPAFTITIATGPLVQEEIRRAIKRRAARSAKGLDWTLVDPPAPAKKSARAPRKKKESQS